MSKTARTEDWHRWEMAPLPTEEDTAPRASKSTRTAHASAKSPKVAAPAPDREADMKRQLFEIAKQEAREQAWKVAYDAGYQAGHEQGEREAKAHETAQLDTRLNEALEPIERLVQHFAQALSDYQDTRTRAVTELALETGRQLAGHALTLTPEYIVDDVQALLDEEGHGTDNVRVYLSPEDVTLVQERLGMTFSQTNWQLRSDSALSRGDCRIETDQRTRIGTRHDRWQRLMHALQHKEH